MSPFEFLWPFFILSAIQPIIRQRLLETQRPRAFRPFEDRH